jgi:thioredoxin 1
MDIIKSTSEYDALLKDNKSVFVDFYADWCGPCKMVGPLVEELSKEETDVKFVKVNVDDTPDIAQRYGIMSIPTLIAFKNGEIAGSALGFQPKEALAELVAKAK